MVHVVRESLRVLFVVGTTVLPILYWLLGRAELGVNRQISKRRKEGANSESHGEEQRVGSAAKLEFLGKKV